VKETDDELETYANGEAFHFIRVSSSIGIGAGSKVDGIKFRVLISRELIFYSNCMVSGYIITTHTESIKFGICK